MELPEDNPILVSRLIQCCYTTNYDDGPYDLSAAGNKKYAFVSRLQFNAEMYSMCEKFAMHGMKKVAEKKFDDVLNAPLSTTLNTKHDRILDVIPIVYNTTPENDRGLRDSLLSYLIEHWKAFTALPRLKFDMANNPDFVIDLIGRCNR